MVQGALDAVGKDGPAGGLLADDETRVYVLLVDDDPLLVELVQHYLADGAPLAAGIETEILTASSGEEAIDAVRGLLDQGERVACALVDVLMPDGIDGIETVGRIWELDPEVQCTIVTGAVDRVEKAINGRLPGPLLDRWDYLAKPFTQFEIVQGMRRSLSSWLAHRREERRRAENMKLLLHLANVNKELEATVRERTRALAERNAEQEKKNKELEKALRDLESAQGKLLQQEKMACIGQLAAGVAHELNNPIGFVHSNMGTLRRYTDKIAAMIDAYERARSGAELDLDAARKEHKIEFLLEDLPALIEESVEGTERMRKIVSDLKVFSHPAEHEAKYADINEGLTSTLNIVHNELKYKATVVKDLGELPPVLCLPGQVNQVFMNLLVNAGHAIEDSGEITLTTRAEGDEVVVSIADTGCGIPEDVLSRIFDPFFTTKEVGQGTGLGLSISFDIVRKHGGTVHVESEVGNGTTFVIRLPVHGGGDIGGANG